MIDEDGFTLVLRKRKRKKFPKKNPLESLRRIPTEYLSLVNREMHPSDPIPEIFGDVMDKIQDELKRSNFIHQFQKDLFMVLDEWNLAISPQDFSYADSPSISEISPTVSEDCSGVDIICYGLGKFSSSVISMYQLGFLLVLQHILHPVHVHVYDPQFTVYEIDFLKQLGLNVLEVNEHCKRTLSRKSIFFMPHCDLSLYNNLLWANWNVKSLSELAIIGNSFELNELFINHCMETTAARDPTYVCTAKNIPTYVCMANKFVTEIKMSNIFRLDSVFNDLSLHYFKFSSLSLFDSCVWTDLEEPGYNMNGCF